jgi:hypothetical protein
MSFRRILMGGGGAVEGASCGGSGGVDAYTTLMIHSDTTDGSTTFTDSSESAHTITASGNVHHETDQQKFGATSIHFDGTGDYLTLGGPTGDFTYSTNDFAIDLWVYPTTVTGAHVIIDGRNTAAGSTNLTLKQDGTSIVYDVSGSPKITGTSAFTINTWHHVAVCRSGGTTKLFVNGSQVSTDYTTNDDMEDYPTRIGVARDTSTYFTGYLDEIRFSKFARFTGTFTPPTAAYTNTISKWETGVDGNTTLLIKSNTTDGSTTFTDSGVTGHTISAVGTAQHDTAQHHFGTSAILLDGNSDLLLVPSSSEFDMDGGDFTLDCWVRFNSLTNSQYLIARHDGTTSSFLLYKNASNKMVFQINDGTLREATGSTSVVVDTWYHVAGVREGTTTTLYLNGVSDGTASSVGTLNTVTNKLGIGMIVNGSDTPINSNYVNGWLDEIRISKSARWSGDFTPPTYEYCSTFTKYWPGNDGFTKLLIHSDTTDGSTTFTDSSLGLHTPTAKGNAQHDTAQQKFGASSILLDGTGDYLDIPTSVDFDMGSGDFTLDCWMRWDGGNTSTSKYMIARHDGSTSSFLLYLNSSEKMVFQTNDGSLHEAVGSTTIVQDTWYHVAGVKQGSDTIIYVDGVADGTAASVGTVNTVTSSLGIGMIIKGDTTPLNSQYFSGWMDEIRISKGIARWQSDFTPPALTYDDEK